MRKATKGGYFLVCAVSAATMMVLSSVPVSAQERSAGSQSIDRFEGRTVDVQSGVERSVEAERNPAEDFAHALRRLTYGQQWPGSARPTQPVQGPGCASISLTQSVDPATVVQGTVSCLTAPAGQPACWNADNGFARSYDLSMGATAGQPFAIVCVDFGMETNNIGSNLCASPSGAADKDVTVTIYEDTDGGAPTGPGIDLVVLGSVDVTIPDMTALQIFTATFPGPVVAPADSTIVVEVFIPNSDPAAGGDGNVVVAGSNAAGQTAPSYLRSTACGLSNFADFAAIPPGFPDVHLVQTIHGELPGVTGACCDDLTSTCTDTPPVDITQCIGGANRFIAGGVCTDFVPACGAAPICGNGAQDPGEDCDPGNGVIPPDDMACPGVCQSDCTCPISICNVTCPLGGVDEGEPCGNDVNGGCNSGTCVGDGMPCTPLDQTTCAAGMGPCVTAPTEFSDLGSLGTGGSAQACGNGFFDGMIRDTDWYNISLLDGDADGFAELTYTLRPDFDAVAFLIGDAAGDCQMIDLTIGLGVDSDDCIPATETICLPAPASYTIFVAAPLGPVVFDCADALAPFEYTLDVSVADCTVVCGDGIAQANEECDGSDVAGCIPGNVCVPSGMADECTCDVAQCVVTSPPNPVVAIDEMEPCGSDVNGGCSTGICAGDGVTACSPLLQDCPMGLGPCNVDPTAFTDLGALSDGSSVDGFGNDWADNGMRDTDWWSFSLPATSEVTFSLTSEIPASAFILTGAENDCSASVVVSSSAISDDCQSDLVTLCLSAGNYALFVAPAIANTPLFDGASCGNPDAPHNYSINISVASQAGEFIAAGDCSDGIDNDCDGLPDCADPDCTGLDGCAPIPTLSQWGLIVMLLLLLAAGTIVFARRRTIAVA